MKLTFVFLTLFILQTSARTEAQRVTVHRTQARLGTIFQDIRRQTGYTFVYNMNWAEQAGKVSFSVTDMPLRDALDRLFQSLPFSYGLVDRTIVLQPRPAKSDTATGDPVIARNDREAIPPDILIRGRVTDSAGKPMGNVIVTVKGTNQVTITDNNGNYSFANVDPAKAVLVFSFVGYATQEIALNGRNEVSITLKELPQQLEDVGVMVNTGYQKIPKERATGSFEQIDNRMLNQRVSTDILSRLEGVSSVLFDKIEGQPSITVRGLSTINSNTAPLIVVDNFPYEGDISNINPNDVESVTLLKDAAASSIWGVRAGNGVIVITTKKGKNNQPLKVQLTTNVTVSAKPDLSYLKVMSPGDYIDAEQFLFSNGFRFSDTSNPAQPRFSPVYELLFKQQNGQLPAAEAAAQINSLRKVDIKDELEKYMYAHAVNQQYALNVSGGAGAYTYYLSGGWDKNLSELKAGYDRLNFRFQNGIQVLKGLKITAGLAYTQSKSTSGRPGYSDLQGIVYPYTQLVDQSGNALPVYRNRQTYIDTVGQGKLLDWKYYPLDDYRHTPLTTSTNDLLASLNVQYHFLHHFDATVQYQYERQQTDARLLRDVQSFYTRDLVNRFSNINYKTGALTYNIPMGGILDRTHGDLQSHNARGQVNYSQTWGNSNIVALGGMEVREAANATDGYRLYGYDPSTVTYGVVDNISPYMDLMTGSYAYIPSNITQTKTTNHFISSFLNALYTYKGRYSLSVSARRDGSNLFGANTNDKWTPLWSVGGGWVLSQEPFFQIPAIQYLKLRGTYGYSGNLPYRPAVLTLTKRPSASITNLPYAIADNVPNPELKWERTGMFNLGMDFSLKRQVVSGSIDFYLKRGTGLIGQVPVDWTTGIGSNITKNVASMKGQGLDLNLDAILVDKIFKWESNLLFNVNTNKVTQYFPLSNAAYNYVYGGISPTIGKPVYSVLSYHFAGLDANGNPQGLVDGEPSTDYATLVGSQITVNDLVYGGSAIPTTFGNLNNTFSWKGLSMTIAISYKLGYYFRRQSVNYGQLLSGFTTSSDYSQRWQKSGDEKTTTIPSFLYPNSDNRDIFYTNSDVLVDKADHIRLQYINISYDLHFKGTSRWNTLQLFTNINNIGILWRANKNGIDPDYINNLNTVPQPRTLTFGIRGNF